jgi:formate-dependent phosphoribosylglycinamide formyltransferase (GAR transformylase)
VRRVLLLATTTGYQIRSFGEAAQALGVRLVFASDRCDQLEDPWWDQAIPVRFQDEARSVDAVVAACGDAAPDGIVAAGDRPAVLAAYLADAFGLPGHTPAAAAACRNKLATRQALWAAGQPTPWFVSMPIGGNAEPPSVDVDYPAVIKPLALSGSRGVMRVNDSGELAAAFERLRRLLDAPDVRVDGDAAHAQALVEGFISGAEYAVEGLLTRGTLHLLAICDKPDPLDGPFFEETIYRMPSLAPHAVQQRIAEAVTAAAAALGLRHGPVHAECRVSGEAVYVLEVAARPIGGLCSRALRFQSHARAAVEGTGAVVSLEEVLLRHALGEDITSYVREEVASGVMMIPTPKRGVYRSVGGVHEAKRVPGIEDIRITAKADTTLVPLPEGKSYLGFIFARATTPAAVDRALREAHAQLRFVIDREVTLTA